MSPTRCLIVGIAVGVVAGFGVLFVRLDGLDQRLDDVCADQPGLLGVEAGELAGRSGWRYDG